jgi:hypothetical protein
MSGKFPSLGEFNIPSDVFDIHEWVVDEFIDGELGSECLLIYPDKYTECPNCWTTGTMIKTDCGYKDISQISVNDMVFDGHDYQQVEHFHTSTYTGELYQLIAWGISPLNYMTPNHNLYIIKNFKSLYTQKQWRNKNYILQDFKIEKMPITSINPGDAVICPIFDKQENNLIK